MGLCMKKLQNVRSLLDIDICQETYLVSIFQTCFVPKTVQNHYLLS
jgi:hypothetical protein